MKAKTRPKAVAVKAKIPKPRQPKNTGVPAKSNVTNIIMTTLTVGAAGVVGYFGWQYYKKKKDAKNYNLDNEILKIHPTPADTTHHTTITDTPPYIPPVKPKVTPSYSTGDDFPLKKGSKGDNVRHLQQALIDKYGNSILPKFGADGDFGSETQNALKKKGLSVSISESTFNVITQGGGEGAASTSAIVNLGEKLYNAASAKNLNSVLSLLKSIKNKDDYQQVSNSFMQHRLHGVRQTLVNGLLGSFSSEEQKQKIRFEFIRIGLQYNGNKWSLSGFDGQPVVTKEPAIVWVTATQSVNVPALMVLGNEVAKRLDYTLFENNNKYFLIKTQSIKYL
jgi:hypothetical protein